ncbi:MAG: DUF4166 domain-containing protein [Gammaproteobacteria bacterium]|nr:DUF4166 domain-containing protein [Gammaproteobacteria bacterium]NVK88374.1 DUF4166 domain-containing protein [Gammaproteobacteria bacterium]
MNSQQRINDRADKSAVSYAQLLGADWQRLHPEIKQRFAQGHAETNVYQGIMRYVYCSPLGRLLAWLCQLWGNALTQRRGWRVPVRVTVSFDQQKIGMRWLREYYFAPNRAHQVQSTKRVIGEGLLVEDLGAGLCMHLVPRVADDALYFISNGYSFSLFGRRYFLPKWLQPGETLVYQKALRHQRFQFYFHLKHPWFGKLIAQSGIFCAQNTDD